MEITQGMQNLTNDMPIVMNRWTAARVYIQTDGGNLANVKGFLIAIKDGIEYGPIASANQPIIVKEDGGDRVNVDDSLLFYIPTAWTAFGNTTFKVFVYSGVPDTAWSQEPDADNNFFEVNVYFQQETSRTVKLVTMHNHVYVNGVKGNSSDFFYWPWNEGPDVIHAIFRYIPVSWLFLWQNYDFLGPEDHVPIFHLNDWNLSSCDADINYDAELLRLSSLVAEEGIDLALYYGMLKSDQSIWIGCKSGFSGAARYGVSIGKMSYAPSGSSPWYFGGGSTIVHEFFHNLGVGAHIPCSGNEASGGAVDNDYPYLNPCSIAEVDPGGYFGFDNYWSLFSPDLSGPTVISNDPAIAEPNLALPAMSYTSPKWTSALNWCNSLDILGVSCDPPSIGIAYAPPGPKVAAPVVDLADIDFIEADEYLLAIGLVDKQANTAFFHELRRIEDPSNNAIEAAKRNEARLLEALANGEPLDYRLVLRGTDRAILYEHYLLDTSTAHVEEPLTTLGFYELAPWVDGTDTIQILYQNQVILERKVSPNAPSVTLLNPNGGEVFAEGPVEVSWEASDADDDELTYFIQYSPDNGETWFSVVTGLKTTKSVVLEELRSLPGGDQAIFRVTAVDGVNSASDTSDAPFTMPDQPPQVVIHAPAVFAQFATNELVRMLGSVLDLEDGQLPGDALSWESDVDGHLGVGESIESSSLSPGVHHITLRTTDSAGHTAESSVEIFIDPNVVRDMPSEEEFAQGLAILQGEVPDIDTSDIQEAATPNDSRGSNLFVILGIGLVLMLLIGSLLILMIRRARN